jgi:integrase/recombinase XerD
MQVSISSKRVYGMEPPNELVLISALSQDLEKRYTYGTVSRYLFAFKQFIVRMGYQAVFESSTQDMYSYFSKLRKDGKNRDYIHTEYYGLLTSFDFIYQHGYRHENPLSGIHFKDHRRSDIPFEQLFCEQELRSLLHFDDRYKILQQRDYCILSLYVLQGLTTGEIASLQLADIELKRHIVMVLGDRSHPRTLKLEDEQIDSLNRYLTFDRPYLLKENTRTLFIAKNGNPETVDSLHHLVSRFRNKFPGRKLNPKTIRQSVIVNWIRSGMDILEVQILAGHRHLGSTMRYIPPDTEGLRRELEKYWF